MIVKLIPEEGEVKVDSPSSVSEDERRRRRCGGEPRERQRRASEQPPAASASPSSVSAGNVIVERQSGKSRRHTLGFDLFGGAAVNAGRPQPTVGPLGFVIELGTGPSIHMTHHHET